MDIIVLGWEVLKEIEKQIFKETTNRCARGNVRKAMGVRDVC